MDAPPACEAWLAEPPEANDLDWDPEGPEHRFEDRLAWLRGLSGESRPQTEAKR